MSSKATRLAYFVNRLRNSGYMVDVLFSRYQLSDPRAWTVIIDPECSAIICTCYINKSGLGDNFFEYYDGGQFLPANVKLKTDSVEILVETLVKHGISNKYKNYEQVVAQKNAPTNTIDNENVLNKIVTK